MKASRAYIASLGTSGVLIASFLLLLAVVSAIVAFRGYPGEANNDGLDRLDVRGARPAAAVSETTRARSQQDGEASQARRRDGVRGGRTAGRTTAARDAMGLRSEGGVAGGRAGSGPTPGGDGAGSGSGGSNGSGVPSLPVGRDGSGQLPQAPSAGDVVGGIGDAVDDATGELGGNVGRAAPPVEAPVVETGEDVGGVTEGTAPSVDEAVGGVTEQVGGVTDQVGGVTDEVDGVTGSLP